MVALVVGIAAGALTAQLLQDAPPADRGARGTLFSDHSPSVVDMPMGEAIDTLVEARFRVVAVGRGRVKLQELGVRRSVVRVQGRQGAGLRYCTARLPDCVPIPAR